MSHSPWRVGSFKNLIPPGLEPGTFRVLGERDNHYTTESAHIFETTLHILETRLF